MNTPKQSLPMDCHLAMKRGCDDLCSGVTRFDDAHGAGTGAGAFSNVEAASPCFTPGTMIATPRGAVAIERLRIGDRVITRDNGLQVIRWIGHRDMPVSALSANAHLAPVRIAKGALGNDLPERDMMLSPNHRILVANDKTALHFDETEVLVAAKHLTGLIGVGTVCSVATTYLHLMFDHHEVILSDGTWSESFQPDVQTLAGIGNAQRLELQELFPDLASKEGIEGYSPARRSVSAREVELLK